MKKNLLITFGIILSAQILFAQKAQLVLPDTIPFNLNKAYNICLQAVLNETDSINLMFHTAAGSLTLIQSSTAKLNSLTFSQSESVKSWGGNGEARLSIGNQIQIGKSLWQEVEIWENEYSGPDTDGKFGPVFFQNKVIELDYDKQRMIIHDSLPALDSSFKQHELTIQNGFMFISGNSFIGDSSWQNRFLVHSGYGGAILFDDDFTQKHHLGEKLTIISESELKDAYGNIVKTRKAILPEFEIGDISFKNLPVGFFEGAIGRQKMSVLGADMLRRFQIIFDIENQSVYLKPNHNTELPFPEK